MKKKLHVLIIFLLFISFSSSAQQKNAERVLINPRKLQSTLPTTIEKVEATFDPSFKINEIAKKYYSPEEISLMPLYKKKLVNYLYSSSFIFDKKNMNEDCNSVIKNFDISSYNMKRKTNERVRVLLDTTCETYVELFSQYEVDNQMELIKNETK